MAISSYFADRFSSEEELAKTLKEEKALHCIQGDNPAVYVGTYGKYNGGSIYGEWTDLTTFADYDEFLDFCRLLHYDEEDPELMIQDFENFPRAWYEESGMDEDTFDRITAFAELDEDERAAYEDYLDDIDDDADIDEFREHYMGEWDSEEDFAEHIVNECYAEKMSDEFMARYFDYEKFARDLFSDDYYFTNNHVYQR